MFFAKAAHRLESHHGSQSGMAWETVKPAKPEKAESLSSWLRSQGFSDDVVQAVREGKMGGADIEQLKHLRNAARNGGALSKAQLRSIKPQQVLLKQGKLVNFSKGAFAGVREKREKIAGGNEEVATLKKQVAELRKMVQTAKTASSSVHSEDAVMQRAEAGQRRSESAAGRAANGKACHVCASKDHLKADCPHAMEMRKLEEWLGVLRGEACLLPPESRTQSERETVARLESLRSEVAQAKERAVLPEHLLRARRAEVKKCSDALAAARQQLERQEDLLAEVETEADRLRSLVATEAAAYKQAEAALEETLKSVGPRATACPAPPVPPAPVPPAPALSPQGAAALEELRGRLAGLGSASTIQAAEAAHQREVAAAQTEGREPPSLLAFVLTLLGEQGLEQLELVRFDIAKAVAPAAPAPTAPAAAEVPCPVDTAEPTAAPLLPNRPRAQGGLGDDARTKQRTLKPLPRDCARDHAEAVAIARRTEAREQRMPVRDPLWAAIHTAAPSASAPPGPPAPAAPAAPADAELRGPGQAA